MARVKGSVGRSPASLLACAALALVALSPCAGFAQDLPLPALAAPAPFLAPTDAYWDFWARPQLFGDWGGLRPRLGALGVDVTLSGVDEAVANLSGGSQQTAQEAGQLALQAKFDLHKIIGLEGGSFLVTLVDRWGRNLAADAGIPANSFLRPAIASFPVLQRQNTLGPLPDTIAFLPR